MPPDPDPSPPPGRRLDGLAGRLTPGAPDDATVPILRLVLALSGLDEPRGAGLRRCRAPALRYVESLAARGLGRGDALLRLRRLADRWASPGLTLLERMALDERLRWWIGTVYGERWQAAAPHSARPPTP
jgi:hypothetical protein